MSPENTLKLLAAYPLLYRELREWGFECGDGWFDLVWQVSAEIEAAASQGDISKTAEAWPKVGVLKQKFGALRVQFHGRVSDAIQVVVAKAYEQSMTTCELCGAPAQCDSERELARWVEALCDTCRKAHRPPPLIPDENRVPVYIRVQDGKLK